MSHKKQQKKARPRGRPWRPGQSGNPAGRPKGALNKFSRSVLEAARKASAPKRLDTSRPFETWDGFYWQCGLRFRKDTLEVLPPEGHPPKPPKRFDPRERRTEIVLRRRRFYLQKGWLYDAQSWKLVKL